MISLPHHNFIFWEENFIVGKEKQKDIYFKVSERERNLIEQKIALAECAKLLRYTSNNINQLARTINSGSAAVYPDEVNDICIKQDETNRLFGQILERLSKLK